MAGLEDEGWTGERVARWIRQAEGLERQLAPVSDLLFQAAALAAGEAVLDVGCGTGPTTRTAARQVGPSGRVTGLDVAAPMLEAAAGRPAEPGAATIDWVVADAVTWRPESVHDVVLSRFGVMFFSDPPAAFRALASAVRPGGRLAMAVWARRDESALFRVPLATVVRVLGAEAPPDDEGPFSLHAGTEELLSGAGFSEVEIVEHTVDLPFAGGVGPAEAAVVALDFGPTRLLTTGLEDDERRVVQAALEEALAAHVDDRGQVVLDGRVRIVTARRP